MLRASNCPTERGCRPVKSMRRSDPPRDPPLLRMWGQISGRVRMLRQEGEAGRALSLEEEQRLIATISKSRSPSLLPFFLLSLDAGLRPSETRALRRSSIRAQWNGAVITEAEILIGHRKRQLELAAWFRSPSGAGCCILLVRAFSGSGNRCLCIPLSPRCHRRQWTPADDLRCAPRPGDEPLELEQAFATACQKSG